MTPEAQTRRHWLKPGPVLPSLNHSITQQYARGALGDTQGLRVTVLYKQVWEPFSLLTMARSAGAQHTSALGLGDAGD